MMLDDRVGPVLETFTSGLDLHDRQIALLRRICAGCEVSVVRPPSLFCKTHAVRA